jgi:DNA-binding NtrC family response regulator
MLDDAEYDVQTVTNSFEAEEFLRRPVDVAVCDAASDRDMALGFISQLREQAPDVLLLFVVERGDVETAVEAMKLGAVECLAKPLTSQRLRDAVRQGADTRTERDDSTKHQNVNGHDHSGRRFDIPEGTSLEELEWAAVQQALEHNRGNRTHAAQELGISVRTLQRKLKTWTKPRVLL